MKAKSFARRAGAVLAASALLATVACSTGDGGGNGGNGSSDGGSGNGSGGTGGDESFNLSYAIINGQNDFVAPSFTGLADWLEEESDGRITTDLYWSGSLSSFIETLPSATSGLADMTTPPTMYYPQDLPISNWIFGAVNSPDPSFYASNTLVHTLAKRDLLKDPVFEAEFESANVELLGVYVTTPYMMFCTDVITDGNVQGKAIRSSGELAGKEIEAMGGIPTSVPSDEAYDALQRGLLDCATMTISGMDSFGYTEVAPYFVEGAYLTPAVMLLTMNRDKYLAMPEDLQQLMHQAGERFYTHGLAVGDLEGGAEYIQPGQLGETFEGVQSPEALEALQAHQLAAVEAIRENPPAGLSTEEAHRLYDFYFERVDFYMDALEDAGINTSDEGSIQDILNSNLENVDEINAFFEAHYSS